MQNHITQHRTTSNQDMQGQNLKKKPQENLPHYSSTNSQTQSSRNNHLTQIIQNIMTRENIATPQLSQTLYRTFNIKTKRSREGITYSNFTLFRLKPKTSNNTEQNSIP